MSYYDQVCTPLAEIPNGTYFAKVHRINKSIKGGKPRRYRMNNKELMNGGNAKRKSERFVQQYLLYMGGNQYSIRVPITSRLIPVLDSGACMVTKLNNRITII